MIDSIRFTTSIRLKLFGGESHILRPPSILHPSSVGTIQTNLRLRYVARCES